MANLHLAQGGTSLILSTRFRVALGWKPGRLDVEPDLDASVFMLNRDQQLPDTEFFVFYNNLQSPDQAVEHSGDTQSATGGNEDQETLTIDLSRIDKRVQELLFVVTIHEADQFQHHFGMIESAYIRLIDPQSREEILRYTLTEDFAYETAVTFARIHRTGDDWHFEALGKGERGGLQAYVNRYN